MERTQVVFEQVNTYVDGIDKDGEGLFDESGL
jgi:hypothetical protein